VDEKIRLILEAGIRAPSGDNTQPWLLRYSEEDKEVELFVDEKADPSFFNVGQRASFLAAGAFFENVLIASRAHDIAPQYEIFPIDKPDTTHPVARIKFIEGKADKEGINLYPAIGARTTNRQVYRKTPLDTSEIDSLIREATSIEGAGLSFLSAKDAKKTLSSLVFKADVIRVERRDLHEFLCSTIRWKQPEIDAKKDGMPLRSLEAGFGGDLFLRLCSPWPVMNIMNKLGVGRAVAMHSRKSVMNSGAMGLITVAGNTPHDFFQAGRALERTWLAATSLGLAMQPVTAITLFFLRQDLKESPDFSPKHKKILADIRPKWRQLWGNALKDRSEALLFRIGKAVSPPTARAIRKPLDSFML